MTRRLADIDVTDREDGRILVWDAGSGIHVYQDPATGGGATTLPYATYTANRVADENDLGSMSRMDSGSALSFTVEDEATQDWPDGAVLPGRQVGVGTVTVVEGSGVTINPPAGKTLQLAGQGSEFLLHYVGSDTWDAVGGFAEDES